MTRLGLGQYDIRSMFVPRPGRKLIIADYSGIEAVILAGESGDEVMLEKLAGDIHTFVAQTMFKGCGITVENKDEEPYHTFRDCAKTLTYGTMYGTTGWNLFRSLSLTLASVGYTMRGPEEGDEWVAAWKSLFPKAGQYLDEASRQAVTQFYVTTALGRRRRWNPLYLQRAGTGAYNAAKREGANARIQSGSADMTKMALRMMWDHLDRRRADIVMCVHDETVTEVDDDYAEEAAQIVKYCMEEAGVILYPATKPFHLIKASPKISHCYNK